MSRSWFVVLLVSVIACNAINDVTPQVDYVALGDGVMSGGDAGDTPPPASFAEVMMAAGPRAWYRFGFDDATGSVAHDRSGGGHHGAYALTARPGIFGALPLESDTGASIFDDVGSGIACPPNGAFTDRANLAFSVTFMVNLHHLPSANGLSSLFVQGRDDATQMPDPATFRALVSPTGFVVLRVGGSDVVQSTHALDIGRWYQLTIIFSQDTFRLYFADVLEGQSAAVTVAITDGTSIFGGERFPAAAHLDEVAFFDRALEQTELTALATARNEAAAPASCTLVDDTRTSITTAGTYERLAFAAPLALQGSGITLRNVTLRAEEGLLLQGADDAVLEDVDIHITGARPTSSRGIRLVDSDRVRLTRVRVVGAGTAVEVSASSGLVVRGLSVQASSSSVATNGAVTVSTDSRGMIMEDVEILDFDAANLGTSSVLVGSTQFDLRRAVIAGNPALDSVGMSFAVTPDVASQPSDADAITDIDIGSHHYACLRLGGTERAETTRLRCISTLCNGLAAGQADRGFAVVADAGVLGFVVQSTYAALCGPVYSGPNSVTLDIVALASRPRDRLNVRYCWE